MPDVARRPRNSVSDRPGRLKLLLRRQRRRLRPAGWTIFAVVVLLFCYGLVHSGAPGGWLANMRERLGKATAVAGLRVTDIVIEGRYNTPEPLLRAALGASRGDAILGFSVGEARTRIETLTWVEHATVERRLPGIIVVKLDERRPFAVWQNQGKFALIDRDGQLVTDQDVSQFRSLPLVVGAGAPGAATALLDALTARGELALYHPLPAARAEMLSRLGRRDEAIDACRMALASAKLEPERRLLARRLAILSE